MSTHTAKIARPLLTGRIDGSSMMIAGEIDDANDRIFSDLLVQAFDRSDVDHVDLTGVTFFGCVGIDILLTFSKIFDGRISTSHAIDRILDLCRVELVRR